MGQETSQGAGDWPGGRRLARGPETGQGAGDWQWVSRLDRGQETGQRAGDWIWGKRLASCHKTGQGTGDCPGGKILARGQRLAKGQKYFDSGDYQMAKQKNRLPGAGTPGTVMALTPAASMAGAPGAPGSVAASSGGGPSRLTIPTGLGQPPPATGDTIPTPELVPMRKTPIIQPLHDHSTSMHLASDPAHVEPGRPLLNPAVAKLSS